MEAIPLAFLSDPSAPAEFIFNGALVKSGKLFVPKGSRLVIPSGPNWIGGIDLRNRKLREGHPLNVSDWLQTTGGRIEHRTWLIIQRCLEKGGSVWVVADEKSDLGIVWLFDGT